MLMYEKGSYIVKTLSKVCKVEDIVKLEKKSDKLYYLLLPVEDRDAKIYTPVETAESNTRRVMTEDEVYELIAKIPDIEEAYITNEKLLEQKYKDAIKSRDPELLVGIIKMIYLRNKDREIKGKKMTAIDQKYFKLAEDYLYSEIAFVLGKDKNEIRQMIEESAEKNTDILSK